MGKLSAVINQINKTYGEGTIMFAGKSKTLPVIRQKTGVFALDCEIGGGLPKGRVIMIHGPFSSGKTSVALKLASEIQKGETPLICWIDAEGTFDTEWAAKLGVDVDKLLICSPDEGQKGLDIAEEIVKTGECGLLVIDSIATIVPKEELEKSMEEWQMGLQARVINKFIRKITAALQPKGQHDVKLKNNCIVLLLNQQRQTMDKYHPVTTPGGLGKDFAASIVISLRKGEMIADANKQIVGHEIFFKVPKNKTFAPLRDGVFEFYVSPFGGFNEGSVNNHKSVILYALQHNVIERSGSFFKWQGKKWQGKEQLFEYLLKNPDKYQIIEDAVMKFYKVGSKEGSAEPKKEKKKKKLLLRG